MKNKLFNSTVGSFFLVVGVLFGTTTNTFAKEKTPVKQKPTITLIECKGVIGSDGLISLREYEEIYIRPGVTAFICQENGKLIVKQESIELLEPKIIYNLHKVYTNKVIKI